LAAIFAQAPAASVVAYLPADEPPWPHAAQVHWPRNPSLLSETSINDALRPCRTRSRVTVWSSWCKFHVSRKSRRLTMHATDATAAPKFH